MSLKKAFISATVLMALLCAPAALPPGGQAGAARAEADLEGPNVVDDRPYRFVRGVVSGDDGWRIIINEGVRVRITRQTEVLDARSVKTSRYDIRPGAWVYAEGPVDFYGDVEAEKVYVLPGHLKESELKRYPFIKGW
jgi:hypothetical protein